ncbi:MAG: hypothetical protein WA989_12380 [Henriciella sp.]|uniref:hypothetical protein n=1 Tax=Henriciella sp. TaxID=1968823 RepID=UPI003C706D8F
MTKTSSFRYGTTMAVAAIISSTFLPAMASASCYQKGKALKAQQAEAAALKTDRDELVISVEDAGDHWEEVEATRNWTADHADTADQAKAEYEALKEELFTLESELQAKAASLNEGVAAYNRICATNK